MMKVLVVSDAHLWKTETGYWCNTAMHGYNFWKRYSTIFDEVIVVARVMETTEEKVTEGNYIRADGKGVTVYDLPFVRGIKGYALHWIGITKKAREAAYLAECAIFRLPSIPAYILLSKYKTLNKPYAVEVVIDPADEYASIIVLKHLSIHMLKKACEKANGVSYVTRDYLQNRSPSGKRLKKSDKVYFESYYSSIDLQQDFFYYNRKFSEQLNKVNIIHVANSINNENKGHRVVLNVLRELRYLGVKAEVTFVGDGSLVEYFKSYAKQIGVLNHVFFTGYISSKLRIRELLIESDFFLFPTKAEGLPRVLIEAMATGLPCLSSNVDGIPELLDKEFLFSYNDVKGYTQKLNELIHNTRRLENISNNNIAKASEYLQNNLEMRRNVFYNELRNAE